MATMQIPIPALMPVISQGTIEEEARTSDTVFRISFGPINPDGMLPFFFSSRHPSANRARRYDDETGCYVGRDVFSPTLNHSAIAADWRDLVPKTR